MLGLCFMSVAKHLFQNFKFGAARVYWDVVFFLEKQWKDAVI